MKFTEEPSNVEILAGESIMLNCFVTGSEPITYQWFKDGSPLPTETSNTFSKMVGSYSDFGSYYCVVNNSVNTIQSREAILTGLSYTSTIVLFMCTWILLCSHYYFISNLQLFVGQCMSITLNVCNYIFV